MRNARISAVAALFVAAVLFAAPLRAEEVIEQAGVAVGVTAGNLLFVPIKAIALTVGALSGALSYVATGGNEELSRQIWRDTLRGPYVITPEIARTAIGHRPEIEEPKNKP